MDKSRTNRGTKSCETCGKSFQTKVSLKVHRTISSGDKQYKGDVCGKMFVRKYYLTQHMLVHSGKKNFNAVFVKKKLSKRSFKTTLILVKFMYEKL